MSAARHYQDAVLPDYPPQPAPLTGRGLLGALGRGVVLGVLLFGPVFAVAFWLVTR